MTDSMQRRLTDLGVLSDDLAWMIPSVARLYSTYAKAGGDRRTRAALEDDARHRVHELRERGFDLSLSETESAVRLDRLYSNARAALYAELEDGVITDACPHAIRVRTTASSRDHYLATPEAGERIRPDDLQRLRDARPAAAGNPAGRLRWTEPERGQRATTGDRSTASTPDVRSGS